LGFVSRFASHPPAPTSPQCNPTQQPHFTPSTINPHADHPLCSRPHAARVYVSLFVNHVLCGSHLPLNSMGVLSHHSCQQYLRPFQPHFRCARGSAARA
jgi:hypothetical protein